MDTQSHSDGSAIAFFACPIIVSPKKPDLIRFIRDLDEAAASLADAACYPVFLMQAKYHHVDTIERAKSHRSTISVHAYDEQSNFSLRSLLLYGLRTEADLLGMIRPGTSRPSTSDIVITPFCDWFPEFLEPMLRATPDKAVFLAREDNRDVAFREDEYAAWAEKLPGDPFHHFLRTEIVVFRRSLLERILG